MSFFLFNDDPERTPSFKCIQCDFTASSKRVMKHHIQNDHQVDLLDVDNKVMTIKRTHQEFRRRSTTIFPDLEKCNEVFNLRVENERLKEKIRMLERKTLTQK